MLLTSCTLPIVNALGNGSAQNGYQKTAALYAVIAVILNFIVVSVCKENVTTKENEAEQVNTVGIK